LVSARRDQQPVYRGRLLPDWVADLAHQDPAQSRAAREAIVALGPDAVPALIRTVNRSDPVLARPLVRFGRYLPAVVYRTLFDWMKPTQNANARAQALQALALLGPTAQSAVSTLARLTRSPPAGPEVTEWMLAVQALGKIGPSAVDALVEAFTRAPDSLRVHSLLALAELGPAGTKAIPVVLAAFPTLPQADGSALAGFLCAVDGETTLPQFCQLLASPDPALRFKASEVLCRMARGKEAIRDGLIATWATQTPSVRLELLRALGRVDPPRGAVGRFMVHALEDPDEPVRLEAAAWLRERLSPTALRFLLANEPRELQARARQVLGGSP
jgi:HEAT repeat protein